MSVATQALTEIAPPVDRELEVARFMERLLQRYHRPALLVSFGKDSMVLVHLFASRGWPVLVLWPAHVAPSRWAHAFAMIQKYQLRVHFIPPQAVAFKRTGAAVHLVTSYQTGGGNPVVWEQALVHTDRGRCAVEDLLPQPAGEVRGDWDVLVCGQKDGDTDFAGGKLSRVFDVLQNPGGADLAFPLREWSDDDVWEYLNRHDVPVDGHRYDRGSRSEIDSIFTSNDWVPACIKCCDPREPETVFCPRLKVTISNRSTTTPYL